MAGPNSADYPKFRQPDGLLEQSLNFTWYISWNLRRKVVLWIRRSSTLTLLVCLSMKRLVFFKDQTFSDLILEASRQKMVVVLMDFTNSGHFAHIDHAIEDVKATLSYLSLNELIVPKFPILKLMYINVHVNKTNINNQLFSKSFNDVPIVFKLVREKWTIIPMKSGIISIFYQKQSFPWFDLYIRFTPKHHFSFWNRFFRHLASKIRKEGAR